MDARCEPASTARMLFGDQFVEVERTRKPVTPSSLGPPPAPYCHVSSDHVIPM